MTVCLRAVSIGPAVPRLNFETSVHSVFRTVLNLRLNGESTLLTLLVHEEADLPQGIRLDAPHGFGFSGLSAGTRCYREDGRLILGSSLTIDLREGRYWECDLASLDGDMTDRAVAAAWRHSWRALKERRERSGSAIVSGGLLAEARGPQSIMVRQMGRTVHGILRATRQLDVSGMNELGALVGLGFGLTPGGDDLLTGYLAGLWCTTRGQVDRRGLVSAAAQIVIHFSTRTNDISRTYLCHAARGQVSRRLLDLATTICSGADRVRVLGATEAAMCAGHTSGMEAVNGLLLGLAAWDGPHLLDWAASD